MYSIIVLQSPFQTLEDKCIWNSEPVYKDIAYRPYIKHKTLSKPVITTWHTSVFLQEDKLVTVRYKMKTLIFVRFYIQLVQQN